jgi:hypothetical protein
LDSTYGILEYEANSFLSYLSYHTNTPLEDIKKKRQITYLDNYLQHFKGNNKKIFYIFENEYVDQHYLDDYAAYYVRCFYPYKKTCIRIHFFATDCCFTENLDESLNNIFLDSLEKCDQTIINNDNYLGFLVVRPIPHTFLAKMCIRPSNNFQNSLEKKLILKEYYVSLFGIGLTVNSIAYQEQDKILSACATTSLWSFYHAHPNMYLSNLPSSNKITKSAYQEQNGYDREFPNSGLTTDMICKSLREYGLSPEYYEFLKDDSMSPEDKKTIDMELKEYIYAYISSGLPLILGVQVQNNKKEFIGMHAVTILGYALSEKITTEFIAHGINYIQVNDDRNGPFFRIYLEDGECNAKIKDNTTITIKNHLCETYKPDTLILGLNHKIRISYKFIKNTCVDFTTLLSAYYAKKGNVLFNHIQWDITLKENSTLKKNILKSSIHNKKEYLLKSWPKYIWCASAYLGNEKRFELLFDATDIYQGDVFLDVLRTENKGSMELVKAISIYFSKYLDYDINQSTFASENTSFIIGMMKFFNKRESVYDSLDMLYGHINFPKNIKSTELEKDKLINRLEERINQKTNYVLDKNLDSEYTYIWVIDREGFLCIGKEKQDSQEGHPTLTNGMPARIAGQLEYDKSKDCWLVDPFSGRYSSQYAHEDKLRFIEKVITHKFNIYFKNDNFVAKPFNPK